MRRLSSVGSIEPDVLFEQRMEELGTFREGLQIGALECLCEGISSDQTLRALKSLKGGSRHASLLPIKQMRSYDLFS